MCVGPWLPRSFLLCSKNAQCRLVLEMTSIEEPLVSCSFPPYLFVCFLVYEILRMGTIPVKVKGDREGVGRLSRLPPTQASHALAACVCVGVGVGVCGVCLSRVLLFVTPWSAACQAPLSMGFSMQGPEVGCHFLLLGIFPTQGSNLSLLHCRQALYH